MESISEQIKKEAEARYPYFEDTRKEIDPVLMKMSCSIIDANRVAFLAGASFRESLAGKEGFSRENVSDIISMVCDQFNAGFAGREEFINKTIDYYLTSGKVLTSRPESGWIRPKVICYCGSTRFEEQFMLKRWESEKQGIITFGINILPDGYFGGEGDHGAEKEGVKEILDELHKRKIDLSDEVFVLNVGGYIGDSTRSEIEYAVSINKPVKYLEPLPPAPEK